MKDNLHNNKMENLFFEQRMQLKLEQLARRYNQFHNLRSVETNPTGVRILEECQQHIYAIVQKRDSVAEFQELLVKFSGYNLKS